MSRRPRKMWGNRKAILPVYPLEVVEQRKLAKYLDMCGLLWLHVPNEGRRPGKTGDLAVAAGLKRGAPDNLIFDLKLAIELKRRTNGPPIEPTDHQRRWLERLSALGWDCFVCEGAEDAIEVVKRAMAGDL